MKAVIQRVTRGCIKGSSPDSGVCQCLSDLRKEKIIQSYEFDLMPYSNYADQIFLIAVNEEVTRSIGRGLVILIGISSDDTQNDVDFISKKILNIRFFEDENGKKWSKNVMEKEYEILCMSQFTLCYSLKGNKLNFNHAMQSNDALKFYDCFLDSLKCQYKPEMIKNGEFGSFCQVQLSNDGPVTIVLESNKKDIKFGDEE